jgi:hypothetical protein
MFHSLLVEGIDLRDLGDTAALCDGARHPFDGTATAAGQKDARAFSRESPSHRATDGATGSVDHRGLAFEQHDFVSP